MLGNKKLLCNDIIILTMNGCSGKMSINQPTNYQDTLALELADKNIRPLEVVRYSPSVHKDLWDTCVDTAKNHNILFYRNFMDYHADRFTDHSFVCLRGGKTLGVFPANSKDDTLYSHQGLTFGGFICPYTTYAADVLLFYVTLIEQLKTEGIKKIICKPLPYPFFTAPAEEERYALFRLGALLQERHISSVICFSAKFEFTHLRKRGALKAAKAGIEIQKEECFDEFVDLLNISLKRHNTSAKHTADELRLLHGRFPTLIELWTARKNGELLSGVLLFISKSAVHTQYIAVNTEGVELGALDLLLQQIIDAFSRTHGYLSFGISTENYGQSLNYGLIHQKEGFGARGVVHDIYYLDL